MMTQDSEYWDKIDALLEKLLEEGDLDILNGEDPALAAEARKLYENHLKAEEENFLEGPITMVRVLTAEEGPVFSVGQVLCSRFTVLQLLGSGGMGQVYLAEDQTLGETVAVKTIRTSLAREERFRQRFLAEVRNARRVTHPNVCRIFDLFEDGGTIPFYSMEFLRGPRLDQAISDASILPSDSWRRVALQLAEGLHAAHLAGVVHGDFKPQNVILVAEDKSRRAVITDFGLARLFGGTGAHPNWSIEAGTPRYRAPELSEGQPSTVQSDIFAFGKVASQLLPKWTHSCCEPDPAARPQSLTPLIEELRGANRSRRWILAGFGGTALAAGGWAVDRLATPTYALQSRARIMVNRLAFDAGLTHPAGVLRQLLVLALRQSPLLAIVPDDRMGIAIDRWRASEPEPASLAELATAASRERAALILTGHVRPASRNGLELALGVFRPESPRGPLFEVKTLAGDARKLVELAARAAQELRREFGESGTSLATLVPLEHTTSASPEAVDYYFRAVREYERTDTQAALTYLDRAIAIDPAFALAHHYRSMCLWNSSQTDAAIEASRRAFDLRARISERERNWVEFYYHNLNGDYLRSLDSIRRNSLLFPDEAVFQRQTASTLCQLRQFDKVIPYNVRAVELDPFSDNTRSEHLVNLVSCERPDEALATWRRYVNEGITTSLLGWGAGLAYLSKGEYAKADECYAGMQVTSSRERWARLLRAGPAIMQGRFAETALTLKADLAFDTVLGDSARRSQRLMVLSGVQVLMGNREAALTSIAALCELPAIGPSIRYVRAGIRAALDLADFDLAEKGLTRLREIESRFPSTHIQGALAQSEGLTLAFQRKEGAEALLTKALGLWPDLPTLEAVAWWQRASEQWDACNRMFGAISRMNGQAHRNGYHALLVLSWIGQAESLAAMSHFDDASRLYRRVLEHWEVRGRGYPVVVRVREQYDQILKQR